MSKGHQSALLRLVEQKTLYTVIVRLMGKHSGLLAQAAIKGMKVFKDRIKTITFDNGLDFPSMKKLLAS